MIEERVSPGDVVDHIDAVMAELAAVSGREIGGSASAARANASRVAAYLRQLHAGGRPLPRHGGRPSPGKVAQEMASSESPPVRFNRQNFDTNPWCGRMLAAYAEWEQGRGITALAQAQQAAEAKEPAEERLRDVERENLLLRAEVQQLRRELALFRGVVADTGRLP